MITRGVRLSTVALAIGLGGCGGPGEGVPEATGTTRAGAPAAAPPDVASEPSTATTVAAELTTLEIPEAGLVMQFPADRVDVSAQTLPAEVEAAGGMTVAWEWAAGDDYASVVAFPDSPNPVILPIPRLLREGFRSSETGAAVVAEASLTDVDGFPALVAPPGPERFATVLREDDLVIVGVGGDDDGSLFETLLSSMSIEGDAVTIPTGWAPVSYPADGAQPLTALLPPGAPEPTCEAGVVADTTECGSSVAVDGGTIGAFQITGPGMAGSLSDPENDALLRIIIDLGGNPETVRQSSAANDLRLDDELTAPDGRTARLTMFADDTQAVGVVSIIQGGDEEDHLSAVRWLDW